MTGRMTAADTVCCTSNEEFGGRILKHPFLHFSHSLSESISHASFRCSSRREEPSDMTLNVDFTPCHSCKLINLDLTSGFHQPLCKLFIRAGGPGQCEFVVGQPPHTPRHQNVAARRATARPPKFARAPRARSRLPDAPLRPLKFA